MATRQYIGARYVPKFYTNSVDGSTTWESNVVYEPLMYVTLTNGHMYISKKEVPATVGIPSNNVEYWLDVGSYNGMIQDLQDQIDQIVQDLQTTDGNLETLTTRVNRLDRVNQKILFVGDSYGDGAQEFINLTIAALGLDATNLSVTGTGFTIGSGNNGFLAQLQSYTGDKTKIEAIYVLGGLNDSTPANRSNPSTLTSGMSAFVEYAHTNYPNAKLYISYIGNGLDGSTDLGDRTIEYREFVDYFYRVDNNFEYFDMTKILCSSKENFQADGVHPSANGQTQLTKALINFILGNEQDVFYPQWWSAIAPVSPCDQTGNLAFTISGDVFELIPDEDFGVHITGSGTTISGTSWTKVAYFNRLYFNRPFSFAGMCRIDGFDSKSYQNGIIEFKFEHNNVYIRSQQINDTFNGFKSYVLNASAGTIRLIGRPKFMCKTYDIN